MSPSQACIVPVFAGQGTDSINSLQTRQRALCDAASPSGSLLLASCFEAFHVELLTLSCEDLMEIGVSPHDFKDPRSLLPVPSQQYTHNPIISGISLFLVQSLRYLSFLQQSVPDVNSPLPFNDILASNGTLSLGILGFSSGIIPASVVGTSTNRLTYICHSVEAFRLVFWIGVRICQRRKVLLDNRTSVRAEPTSCWSIVCFGIDKILAHEFINHFEHSRGLTATLGITAILGDTCITISGRPDILQDFSATISDICTIHKTTVDALYHSPGENTGVRTQLLADIIRRDIRFPNFPDLKCPIRSTFSGRLIHRHQKSGSLVEIVLDMLLLQPVNWDTVVRKLSDALPSDAPTRFVNFGPGSGLLHGLKRSFLRDETSFQDMTSVDMSITEEAPSSSTILKQEPIAIVGMAINMPGAPDTNKLWEVLEKGINTITEIPKSRFKVQDYTSTIKTTSSRTMRAHTGNFIDSPEEFDHKFFKISPREARSMDPQQRMLLHTAYEALENAGYVPDATPSFQRSTFGCYVGAATQDYVENLRDDIDVYYSTGTLKAFLSGRISYAMQLSGPSMVVDTACSSSAVAIYQACRALANKDCRAALAGGVNVITSPDMFLGLDRGHFLSPTGSCKTFDAAADGYSRGEGTGLFVLKRLSDAISEQDNIIGVIRGIEVNQSGMAESITHPHSATQTTLFQQLLQKSGMDASRVSVVEAHGTGTQAGDPGELCSIRAVFARQRKPDNPLHVTSVKANIGHLEAASGAAGLAKLLLMLRHRSIPPQISFSNLNPKIASLESDNIMINTSLGPWPSPQGGLSRVAVLNNFGAAGSNAALLLEEHSTRKAPEVHDVQYVFGLSAKSLASLEEIRTRYLDWLRNMNNSEIRLGDMAYTLMARRQIYEHRIAFTARTQEELVEKLSIGKPVQVTPSQGNVVFVFSGQGSQYLGMGSTLYSTCALFKHHIDECQSLLLADGYPGIIQVISTSTESDETGLTEEFETYQTAIVALEYALSKLWMQWGVLPCAVVGHSLGEYSALVIAGVLTIADALLIVAKRARLMRRMCSADSTGMLAVNVGYRVLLDILASQSFPEVTIASAMQPVADELLKVTRGIIINAPTIPIVSNVLGDVVYPGNSSVFVKEYFSRHCRHPVLFHQGVCALTAQPGFTHVSAWIEIGPHTPCLPMIKSVVIEPSRALFLPSLRKGRNPWAILTGSLSKLYLSDIRVLWREVFSHLPSISCIDLPSYPFANSKFWITYKEPLKFTPTLSTTTEKETLSLIDEYSMLHSWIQYPAPSNENTAIFNTPIHVFAGYIQGHKVAGYALCPASIYLEQVLAGIDLTKKYLKLSRNNVPVLQNVQFASPLVYRDQVSLAVRTHITLHEDGTGMFTVTSTSHVSCEESIHVRGKLSFRPTSEVIGKFARASPNICCQAKAVDTLINEQLPERFSTRTAYEVVFSRVVDYSKEYHTMQSLTVSADGTVGSALMKLPSDYDQGSYVAHPIFIDTLLHIAGFMANMQGGINEVYICSDVSSVKLVSEGIDYQNPYLIYCSSSWTSVKNVMRADAYAIQVAEPKRIVAHLKGMQFRRIGISSFKRGLSIAAGETEAVKTRRRTNSNPMLSPSSLESFVFSRPRSSTQSSTSTGDNSTSSFRGRVLKFDMQADVGPRGLDVNRSMECYTGCLEPDLCGCHFSSVTSQNSSAHSSPRTFISLEEHSVPAFIDDLSSVKSILSSVLDMDIQDMGNDVDLHTLGLDSLTSIEALQTFQAEFGLKLPYDLFRGCSTVQSVHTYILEHLLSDDKLDHDVCVRDAAETPRFGPQLDFKPTLLQRSKDDDHLPLFLVHDGSGLIHYYSQLSPLGRDIWALHNPLFVTGDAWESLEVMAHEYAQHIMEIARGPILLGGWSFGGVLAFEVANQLTKMNATSIVKGVLLIDAPSPINHVPLSDAILDFATRLGEHSEDTMIAHLIKTQFRMNSQLLQKYTPMFKKFPALALLRSREGFDPEGLSDVPAWLADRRNHRDATSGWESLVGVSIRIWDIPGNHFEPFHDTHIECVSIQIAEACSYLESLPV
ncbi:hypothetical protein SERLA73DRAFT_163261 [Serpula lacrymans var. lacrymans S7.3]|uniref:Uncharacterized protein n=1 Tax=Serpula lacrymans var. lacrymans (strain S7.3) TaxID=936435 RepID=F8QCI0_SERL3|nr:hypothetical protein SERLA73DRAFT_163261 [Serpula lacrymans var. lacrymans S7.3]